ncbi:Ppx/GppA phosphatase family protein [Tenacibaculum jejuense]|uniref:Ppx/GppA phosphatase N-terminal domain-containing protein n=1 Tax=Tenacibaculum jejuense TaxID=584609 RepID=A0A238U6B0_9FLAO|nr:hypothetical protein [Tenacibaculum jejuense]SNR13910.1 conserved protein of unknown function [Tenacibaculum jejuense]
MNNIFTELTPALQIMKKTILFILLILFLFSCKSEKEEIKTPQKELDQSTDTNLVKEQFRYQPVKPENGKLKAVVELGASGFNSFIINVDEDKNWEIKNKEYGNSSILESHTNTKEVSSKLKSYIKKIIDFGVDSKDIHFVVSSGADKKNITQTIKKELKDLGYNVNVVTAEEEGQFALKAVMPKSFEDTAFVVDIGSGNTKISYVEGSSIISKETYGAKYFQNNLDDKKVYKEVNAIAGNIPEQKQKQYFIIGGVPYQLAKKLRKDKERYTLLNTSIEAYQDVIEKKGAKVKSGVNIFNAINDATKPRIIVFDWDSNFTIGFLLSLKH